MTYCVSLSLKNRPVLIVGGGSVSYRKAMRWKKEQAKITVVAIDFCDAYKNSDIILIQKEYEPSDLKDYFIVMAATNDDTLNHRIIQDANQRNMLSMSVHQDMTAGCHAMHSIQTEETILAVSTMGSFPLLGNKLLEKMKDLIEMQYDEKLIHLKYLRKWCLKQQWEKERTKLFLHKIGQLNIHDLIFLHDAAAGKKAVLYVAHGTADPNHLHSIILPFLDKAKNCLHKAAGIVYLSSKVIHKMDQKGIHVSPLEEMLKTLEEFQLASCIVVPVLLQRGDCMNQIEKTVGSSSLSISIKQPLFYDESQIKVIMHMLISIYQEKDKQLLFLYHTSKSNDFDWKRYERESVTILSLYETISLKSQIPVKLIPLFILLGFHGKKDIFTKETSVQKQLETQGYHVLPCMTSLWEYTFIQERLIESGE